MNSGQLFQVYFKYFLESIAQWVGNGSYMNTFWVGNFCQSVYIKNNQSFQSPKSIFCELVKKTLISTSLKNKLLFKKYIEYYFLLHMRYLKTILNIFLSWLNSFASCSKVEKIRNLRINATSFWIIEYFLDRYEQMAKSVA